MKQKLKKAIIDFIFENEKEFNLLNKTNKHFYHYIYTPNGEEYLIGGEDVSDFIEYAIDLITNN